MSSCFQDKEAAQIFRRLIEDDNYYYAANLKIRTKSGKIKPLYLNIAQQILMQKAEEQIARIGKVRILVVKYRQGGVSTGIGARLYKKTSTECGKRTTILTHLIDATNNLFDMAKRFYQLSSPVLKPKLKSSNSKALEFEALDSGYRVATANTKNAGRSDTVQYLHGSEVAFWAEGEEIMKGLGQTVPDEEGTEIWLESTCNGLNFFYKMVKIALAGNSDYIVVFLPWFIEPKYRREPPKDFVLTEEEIELMETFKLDIQQIAWRRNKIITDFGGNVDDFNQEYPDTIDKAFLRVDEKSLINTLAIKRARDNLPNNIYRVGAHVIGLDVARYGDDRTVFTHRQGRVQWGKKIYRKKSVAEVAGIAAKMLEDDPTIDMMFIDIDGLGSGVYDILEMWGYGERIYGVHSNSSPADPKFLNKRAEMWWEMKEWFEDPIVPCIDDDESLHSDLTSPRYMFSPRGIKIEAKEEIKKRIGVSPDEGDALALTFAAPVQPKSRPKLKKWQSGNSNYDAMAA